MGNLAQWISAVAALCSAVAAGTSAYVAYNVLHTTSAGVVINQQTQQLTLFSQFQQEYAAIEARFPKDVLKSDYQPALNSDEYRSLEDYWIFSYAEWYATHRLEPSTNQRLWDNYYSGLVVNAMEIPSLRYTLVEMLRSYGDKNTDMQSFYDDLRALAVKAGITIPSIQTTPVLAASLVTEAIIRYSRH